MISEDGAASICQRVESQKSIPGCGGWLHRLGEPVRNFTPRKPEIKPAVEPPSLFGLWNGWYQSADFKLVMGLAEELGVDPMALDALGCCYAPPHKAFAFPMRDGGNKLIGIRLRAKDGSKYSVRGSKNGLFIPQTNRATTNDWLFVVEGASDAAAAWSMGLKVVGRPNCSANPQMICDYVLANNIKRVVVVPDNDEPDSNGRRAGIRGAEKLEEILPVWNLEYLPPTKDLREAFRGGLSVKQIEASLKEFAWKPGVKQRE